MSKSLKTDRITVLRPAPVAPPSSTTRWVAHRKAQVVRAIEAGVLSVDDALARYRLTMEELVSWRRAFHRLGVRGLQVQYLQASATSRPFSGAR